MGVESDHSGFKNNGSTAEQIHYVPPEHGLNRVAFKKKRFKCYLNLSERLVVKRWSLDALFAPCNTGQIYRPKHSINVKTDTISRNIRDNS